MLSPERLAIKRAKEKRQGTILAAILFGGPLLYCLTVPPLLCAQMVFRQQLGPQVARTVERYSFPFEIVMATPANIVFRHYTHWWLELGRSNTVETGGCGLCDMARRGIHP